MFAVRNSAFVFLVATLCGVAHAEPQPQVEKTGSAGPINQGSSAARPPSPQLQQQIQLNQLNQQVAAELQRIQGEVQIEEARKGLEAARDGDAPILVGTFITAKGHFAEFQANGASLELQVNEYVTPELRVAEIHRDRVVLCKKSSRECKTYTPVLPGASTAAKM